MNTNTNTNTNTNSNDYDSSRSFAPTRTFEFDDLSTAQVTYGGVWVL